MNVISKPQSHLRAKGTTTQLIVGGHPFLMIAGELHNSSASSLDHLDAAVWEQVTALHCNTILAPVYWELIEAEEGKFDFTLVDGLVWAARKRGLRLVPLWFGTWKNAVSTYVPAWIKTDSQRFRRAQLTPGTNCNAISSLCEEACRADAHAFAALMAHLREIDGEHQTVVLVQVENETGVLGASRDHSPEAEEAFRGRVPAELTDALDGRERWHPELRAAWEEAGGSTGGTWSEVFGTMADEVFMAWHLGRYVDRVAEAGQREYSLPLFANAWIVQHPGQKPGLYPSGGPVSRVHDIWRIAAPHLALLAPDIYVDSFDQVCADYASTNNPLLVPEARVTEEAAANALCAFGKHDAMGFSPFGIERADSPLLAETYRLLGQMAGVILEHQGSGQMSAFLQTDREFGVLHLGAFILEARFHASRQPGKAPAAALVIAETPHRFVVVGHGGIDINFTSLDRNLPHCDFLRIEEGRYEDGQWQPGRRMNGDELVIRLGSDPTLLRAELYCYA